MTYLCNLLLNTVNVTYGKNLLGHYLGPNESFCYKIAHCATHKCFNVYEGRSISDSLERRRSEQMMKNESFVA